MLRELAVINPRGKSKKGARRGVTVKVHANPRKKRKHKARRNPRFLTSGKVGSVLKPLVPAAIGGAGALLSDLALAKLPLPENIRAKIASGPLRTIARLGVALALGYGARFVTNKQNANLVMLGGLTVVAYDQIKQAVVQNFPQLGLSGLGGDLSAYQYTSGYNALPVLKNMDKVTGMGAYRRVGNGGGVGEIPVVR